MAPSLARGPLTFWGVKIPPDGHNKFWGQNNFNNEISTIKLLRVQIFSKIRQLLKNHYLRGFINGPRARAGPYGPPLKKKSFQRVNGARCASEKN